MLQTILWGKWYYPHFTDEETETLTCPKAQDGIPTRRLWSSTGTVDHCILPTNPFLVLVFLGCVKHHSPDCLSEVPLFLLVSLCTSSDSSFQDFIELCFFSYHLHSPGLRFCASRVSYQFEWSICHSENIVIFRLDLSCFAQSISSWHHFWQGPTPFS